jgi:hypothetical protein
MGSTIRAGTGSGEMRRETTLSGSTVKRVFGGSSSAVERYTRAGTKGASLTGAAVSSIEMIAARFGVCGVIIQVVVWVLASCGGILAANYMVERYPSLWTYLFAAVIWLLCLPGALVALALGIALLPIAFLISVLLRTF